jgi:hypothetical protein
LRAQLIRGFRTQPENSSGIQSDENAAILDEEIEAIVLPSATGGDPMTVSIEPAQ